VNVIWAIIAFVGTLSIVTLGDMVSEEVRARLDQLPFALLGLARRRLSDELQDDAGAEWHAELHYILRGAEALPVTRLFRGMRFAIGLLIAAPVVDRELAIKSEPESGEQRSSSSRQAPVEVFLDSNVLAAMARAVSRDADQAVTVLYSTNYRSLVRLSVLLVRDVSASEKIVQDAFVAMHNAWWRLQDLEKAMAYLRQSVVNRSRSVLRHRAIMEKYTAKGLSEAFRTEIAAINELERSEVIKALGELPASQREALVLRYYADLPEAEIANAMGISLRAVKSHISRGMAALRNVLSD
jgi:RNA polymerase sigma-70 factor (sigma-E family)